MSLAMMIDGGEPMILSSGLPVTAHRNPQNWNNSGMTRSMVTSYPTSRKRTCGLCHKFAGNKFMRVLYCEADDLVCHERCWQEAGEIDPHQVVEKQYYEVKGERISVKSVVVNECSPEESSSSEKEEDSELSRQRQLQQYNELWAEIVHRQKQKLLDSAPACLPSAPTPKKQSKRLKELKQMKASLEAKEALHLTPVVYAAPSTAVIAAAITAQKMTCDLCSELVCKQTSPRAISDCNSESIQTIYVRVKPRKGGDILCHEACWKVCDYNTKERLDEIARIYRYEANGKLVDKVAFINHSPTRNRVCKQTLPERIARGNPGRVDRRSAPVVPIQSVTLPVVKATPAILTKQETRKEAIEYEPSWRQVDVGDYESLKRNNEQLQLQLEKRREKKRLRAAAKAAKYLDLASVRDISPTPNIPYSKGKVMNLAVTAKEYVPLSAQNK